MATLYTPYSGKLAGARDTDAARAIILRAYKRAKCHMDDTAKALGVNAATLRRWVGRLGMHDELKALSDAAKREGWHHGRKGGFPLGRKRKAA